MTEREPKRPLKIYDVNVEGQALGYTKEQEEYIATKKVTEAKDTFPCGHVLCHECLRKHVISYKQSAWCCPVCNKEQIFLSTQGQPLEFDNNNNNDQDALTLMTHFDDVVNKFNGVNLMKRRLVKESVQTKSVGVTYTKCFCDMCDENHSTMRVVQDYSRLELDHQRRQSTDPFYRRLSQSSIVTTFHSKVSSSCVCVPCTFKDIQANPEKFQYALPEPNPRGDTNNNSTPITAVAEVGKLLTKSVTPIQALRGKNVLDVEHCFRIRDRADYFDFNEVVDQIKHFVRLNEKNLVQIMRKEIEDTGKLYHIQEKNTVDYDMGETVV